MKKEKANDWTCPVCEQETKPDWWSSDGYSCQDCGPVLDEEFEEPLINFQIIKRVGKELKLLC